MIRSTVVINNSLFLLIGVLCFNQLLAADSEDLSDLDFFDDIPTVLTVSRLEQPRSESPSAVTIIDREMIMASGARELAEVFRLVPGFIVGHLSGNDPAVTYHGLGATYNRQLQVIIDGRSAYIPSFGGVPWSSLPVILEDIERIEVTRGPNAASYGANSFLAVINIITREAIQESGMNVSVTHSNDHKNIRDGYFSISQQYEAHDFRFSTKTVEDDGFRAFEAKPNNDSKNLTKFNITSNFLIQQNSKWTIQLGQNKASLSTGDNIALDLMRDAKTINQYQSLRYEQSTHNSTTSINLFHTTNRLDDSFDIPLGDVNFDRNSERSEIEFEKTTDHSKGLRTVWGGSYRKDTVDSFFLLGPNQKQSLNVSRLFAHAEYKFDPDKILNIGGMIEKSDIADTELSPRIAYVQHLDSNHTIRFSYSKAFRNPILFEKNGFTAFRLNITPIILERRKPNPNILPEEIESFEIGLFKKIGTSLQTDIKLYQYSLSNLIVERDTTDLDVLGGVISQFYNDDLPTTIEGIELSLSYKPNANLFIKSGLNVPNSHSDIIDVEHSFPDSTFFILSQYDFGNNHLISGSYYYINNTAWFSFSSHELGNTNKLDLRYAYNFTFNDNTPLRLEIIGQNLLDDYPDYKETNFQEPSIFLKLSSNF